MKRIFSWVLTLSLVCSMFLISPAGCAEMTPFVSTLTNLFNRQENEWMESSLTRATLSLSLIADLYNVTGDNTFFQGLTNPSYIGKPETNERNLLIYFCLEEKDLMITYYPPLEMAQYSIVEKASDLSLKYLIPSLYGNGYYENNPEEFHAAIEIIQNRLNTVLKH